jgi:hypothetical protein
MDFPAIGTVAINTCVRQSGAGSDTSFSVSDCDDANAVATGRIYTYDDPVFCGSDDSYWWHSNKYPNLGFTTCYSTQV